MDDWGHAVENENLTNGEGGGGKKMKKSNGHRRPPFHITHFKRERQRHTHIGLLRTQRQDDTPSYNNTNDDNLPKLH